MSVRTRLRITQSRDQTFFDARGDGVLEDACLGIDFVPRHAQHVGEQPLRQPIAPHDANRNLEALSRQLDIAAHFMLDVAVVHELFQHSGDRRRRNAQLGGKRRRGDAGAFALEAIDRLHVHLEGLGKM